MFDKFFSQIRTLPEGQPDGAAPFYINERLACVRGYRELMEVAAGRTFENGLYRLHDKASREVGQENARSAYPELGDRLEVFGYDWMGTQFAIDFGRLADGEPLVMMLEPGWGSALQVPASFVDLHEEEIVDRTDRALMSDLFNEWSSKNPQANPLGHSDCVGFRIPLSLGGSDGVDNLEVTDCDVYWSFAGQMRRQLDGAPDGTPIKSVVSDT